jgi:cellulose synthase/poly-beta-1,6-N-acetylglucosamine synthase-like glycosyltransferase
MLTDITLIALFWVGVLLVLYTYLGYGFVAAVLVWIRKLRAPDRDLKPDLEYEPTVTLVVAAYNEEDAIRAKLFNSLRLDYPREKLELLFVTDGSSDETSDVVSRVPGIRHLHTPERLGKIAAMNRAMKEVASEIVVFCDANAMLNREAIREIAKWYADPRVGGVAGEKRVVAAAKSGGGVRSEGLYWRYESYLKNLDSKLWSVVGAAGELFSVRTALFEPVHGDTILDDFVILLNVAARGHRVVYQPRAYASEAPSASVRDELKRKIRICAGGFQAMVRLRGLLSLRRHGLLAFQYVSHRVLRWTLAPLFLLLLLPLNGVIVSGGGHWVYTVALASQIAFYLLAVAGLLLRNGRAPSWISAPFYFVVMNYAVYRGLVRFLAGSQSVVWERAARA